MDDASLRTLIEETVNRAMTRTRVPNLRPGTVTSVSDTYPEVLVDGDVEATEMPSITGPLAVGQRVMVMFHPPAGSVVLGVLMVSSSPAFMQTFTATSTWTHPEGARLIEVILIGGGGGGGTGRSDTAGTNRPGGGGGGGGGHTRMLLPATYFDDALTVTVGTGGAGGVNPGAVVADGTDGSSGGATFIMLNETTTNTAESISILASGGGAGQGGTATLGGTGGAGARGTQQGLRGSKASDVGGVGVGSQSWQTDEATPNYPQTLTNLADITHGAPGGGSGGGISTGNTISDGGDGQPGAWVGTALAASGGTSGVANGAGGDGYSMPVGLWFPGGSGGGASAFGGGSGGSGGDGGLYGAGGGGASGKTSGSVVGNGGNGGDGIAVLIAHL